MDRWRWQGLHPGRSQAGSRGSRAGFVPSWIGSESGSAEVSSSCGRVPGPPSRGFPPPPVPSGSRNLRPRSPSSRRSPSRFLARSRTSHPWCLQRTGPGCSPVMPESSCATSIAADWQRPPGTTCCRATQSCRSGWRRTSRSSFSSESPTSVRRSWRALIRGSSIECSAPTPPTPGGYVDLPRRSRPWPMCSQRGCPAGYSESTNTLKVTVPTAPSSSNTVAITV